jgi:hypothetical protein
MNEITVNREALIDAKADELQVALTEWAFENAILQAGECLSFSLRIERVPVVSRNKSGDAMQVSEFFSKSRMLIHGVPHKFAVRINHCLSYGDWFGRGSFTVVDFVSQHTESEISRTPNLGQASMHHIKRLLLEAGLKFKEE